MSVAAATMRTVGKRFCVNGHDTAFHGRDKQGRCRECTRIRNRARYAADPEAARNSREANARWRANPENRARQQVHQRERYYRDPTIKERQRERERARQGITGYGTQPPLGTPCQNPACGRTDELLCVDHDHVSGEFRGWLCRRCNTGIGALGDSETGLLGALSYLRGWRRKAAG